MDTMANLMEAESSDQKILDHYKIDSDKYEIILTSGSLAAIHLIMDNCYPKYKNFVDIIPSWHWPRLMAKDRGYRIHPVHTGKIKPKDVGSEEHTSELQSRLHLVCRLLP